MNIYSNCIKCGTEKDNNVECNYCGVIYDKAEKIHNEKIRALAESEYTESEADNSIKEDFIPPTFQYWNSGQEVNIKSYLRIKYKSQQGELSERNIKVTKYDGSCYMNAHCETKKTRRTFRVDRIISCVDLDTGEIVIDLPQHLLKKYENSTEYVLKNTFEKAKDILLVLLYIGKADGQLRQEERLFISKVARKIASDKRINDQMIEDILNGIDIPSYRGYKLAINRICKLSHRNMLGTYIISKKIIETQQTVHPHEAEAIAYMEKKMEKEKVNFDPEYYQKLVNSYHHRQPS